MTLHPLSETLSWHSFPFLGERTRLFARVRALSRSEVLKRLFDVAVSSAMLAAAVPIMFFVAVLIKLDGGGPVFYTQLRVGLNRRRRAGIRAQGSDRRRADIFGKPFRIFKFRSMTVDAEADGQAVWCRRGDPRVTRIGAFLRKAHLDELPQIFNILSGDMSLVGPRPERPEFVGPLAKKLPRYVERLRVKPGLTGLAQTRHPSDTGLRDVRHKINYDLLYARRMSLLSDFRIVLGTVPKVFGYRLDRGFRLRPMDIHLD